MVGQEHVLRALENALTQGRLHHAYLFTGTRGVGKTTVARILAKAFNCAEGVTAEPCGKCTFCVEIDQCRSVDLIEVDAASRTRVEDTRELLDNVQYAPTQARYKIYLIDEVHMLSGHSFNALLKTLEEPPEHVKFLLATTDPQKLPITVLSRCLQFSLKHLTPQRIVDHLESILPLEQVSFEVGALWELARAADGSMRDALSLTDQAIAFGSGSVNNNDVQSMLGTVNRQSVIQLLRLVLQRDVEAVVDELGALANQGIDLNQVLSDLILLLHRVAMAQALPAAISDAYGDHQDVLELAKMTSPQSVQLLYQTALIGRKDLSFVPDTRAGLEMILLRMLLFRPEPSPTTAVLVADPADRVHSVESAPKTETATSVETKSPTEVTPEAPSISPAEQQNSPSETLAVTAGQPLAGSLQSPAKDDLATLQNHGESSLDEETSCSSLNRFLGEKKNNRQDAVESLLHKPADAEELPEKEKDIADVRGIREQVVPAQVLENRESSLMQPQSEMEQPHNPEQDLQQKWYNWIKSQPLDGAALNLAQNSCLLSRSEHEVAIIVEANFEPLVTKQAIQRLEALLYKSFNQKLKLVVNYGVLPGDTLSQVKRKRKAERLASAEAQLLSDPLVKQLQDELGAELRTKSVVLLEQQNDV